MRVDDLPGAAHARQQRLAWCVLLGAGIVMLITLAALTVSTKGMLVVRGTITPPFTVLGQPTVPEAGLAYRAPAPEPFLGGRWLTYATYKAGTNDPAVELRLGDRELGPGATPILEIVRLGGGRHVYWEREIFFSLPDDLGPEKSDAPIEVTAQLQLTDLSWWLLVSAVLGAVMVAIGAISFLLVSRQETRAPPSFWMGLLPLSLLLIFLGSLLHYVNDPSESYLRITPIDNVAYYDEDKYLETFDSPKMWSGAQRWGKKIGLPAPWWVSRLQDGDTIVLTDGRFDQKALRELASSDRAFIDVFGSEISGDTPGEVAVGASASKLGSASGGHWIRIALTPDAVSEGGRIAITYRAKSPDARLELWGVFNDERHPASIRPRVIGAEGTERTLVYGPAPIRGGFVSEASLKEIAYLDRAGGADAVWRVGHATEHLGTKRFSVAMVLLGVAGLCVFFAWEAAQLLQPDWRTAAFLILGTTGAVFFFVSAENSRQAIADNYVNSAEARRFLVSHPHVQQRFLQERFNPPSPGAVDKMMRAHPLLETRNMLVVGRTFGEQGVFSDASGYAQLGWRIASNDRLTYFAPPVGLSVMIATVSSVVGLSMSHVTDAQAVLYIGTGMVLALAMLRLGAGALAGLAVLLLWLFYAQAAKYTQIIYTEASTFPIVAMLLYVVIHNARISGTNRWWSLSNAVAFALLLAIACYARDVFVVLVPLLIAVFLLSRWDGVMNAGLKGALISMLVLVSWAPVSLLHYDRSIAKDWISVTPIFHTESHSRMVRIREAMTIVTDKAAVCAKEGNGHANIAAQDCERELSSSALGVLLERWSEGVTRFWLAPWHGLSGIPFEGSLYGWASNLVTATIPYVLLIGGLLLIFGPAYAPWTMPARCFLLGAFAFLAVVTALHAVGLSGIPGRMRAPYTPVIVFCAGLALAYAVGLLRWWSVTVRGNPAPTAPSPSQGTT